MEVIINPHTPLTVRDQEGNILYEWIPKTNKIDIKSFVNGYEKGKSSN